ncbi:MAG: 2Fe-2S iron-sulfur cluster binding domain-containing protein [Flavobacteriales bacterium]|nr:2Fe-2S iron-sulfur cluster binding domain-containing protein [Flavobacteriales bacterium]
MIQIKVKDREGKFHQLLAPTDMELNLMELCKAAELPVEGTCGGMALCASCQCYLLSTHNLTEKSDAEEDMLAEAFYVKGNSRLACQIKLSEELDGLEIELAPEEL